MSEEYDYLVCGWEDCLRSFADKVALRKHAYDIHTAEATVKTDEGTRKEMRAPSLYPIVLQIL